MILRYVVRIYRIHTTCCKEPRIAYRISQVVITSCRKKVSMYSLKGIVNRAVLLFLIWAWHTTTASLLCNTSLASSATRNLTEGT